MAIESNSLLATIRQSGLSSTLSDIGEVSLDQLLNDGIVRDFPIVGALISLTKAGITVRDQLFFKKIIRFLGPVSEVSADERSAFLYSLSEPEFKRANEYLLMYIDRLDSNEKAEWLGTACSAYMRGEITFHELHYFAHYLDRVFVLVWKDYLAAIKPWSEKCGGTPRIALDDALALEVVGFYDRKMKAVRQPSSDLRDITLKDIEFELVLSNGGWKFIQVVFGLFKSNDSMRSWLSVEIPGARS